MMYKYSPTGCRWCSTSLSGAMLSIRPLHASQSDWDGSTACTVCCCALARYILTFHAQLDLQHPTTLQHFDSAIAEGAALWRSAGAGFLRPDEALARVPELGGELRVVEELAVHADGPVHDDTGALVVPGLAETLGAWNRQHSRSSVCAVVRGGYTFLLFKVKAEYGIIDTHANSIGRHAHKLSAYALVESGSTGLLLRTLFFAEAVAFIKSYQAPPSRDESRQLSSASQVDLTYLALRDAD